MNTSLTVRLEGECFVDGQLNASVSHSGVTGEPKLGTHLINKQHGVVVSKSNLGRLLAGLLVPSYYWVRKTQCPTLLMKGFS